LAEVEAWAVAGGTWQGRQQNSNVFLNYVLNELTDGVMCIFRGMALQICGAM